MKTQYLLPFLILLLAVSGCQPSRFVLEDRQPTPETTAESTPEIPIDDFTERLQSVQTGNFDFVYAFRRKDGDIFTSEDKKYLKDNAPFDTNQWVLTSDKKAVIAGSNYVFTPENLDALKKRFKIEDYSPKNEEPKKQQNTNVNR